MGSIRRLDNNADPQAFPGANFEIVGSVPVAQCSEAQIEGTEGTTWADDNTLNDAGAFAGFDLTGKILHITAPPANAGDYTIASNTNDLLIFAPNTSETSFTTEYYVTDGGELILTRNATSFASYIHAAGYAYTFKGGKLHTNMPNGQIKDACTILWDPLK